ncbi:hypothetical protein CTAYLR_009160 [Chrysophaeum taylorii]|uniref:SH3 domain-containing protein n=1 Tax=Chrysophaeum taylorii TaxID=2483200 RepID=A0AAD7UJN8_9STRA|nr:hypothetical protein CTAYLR_009160 [Chrysophaeum taylorii]
MQSCTPKVSRPENKLLAAEIKRRAAERSLPDPKCKGWTSAALAAWLEKEGGDDNRGLLTERLGRTRGAHLLRDMTQLDAEEPSLHWEELAKVCKSNDPAVDDILHAADPDVPELGELESLGSLKTMNEDDAQRYRELLEREIPSGRRPNTALILQGFEATEGCQVSVKAGDTVTVLDKLPDGWWLVDKSCGEGRGPFGLVPGMRCCWAVHDPTVNGPKAEEAPPPLPPRSPPRPPPDAKYTEADLEDAYSYLNELIHGDALKAVPPANFNALCVDDDFAARVKAHADYLRTKPPAAEKA